MILLADPFHMQNRIVNEFSAMWIILMVLYMWILFTNKYLVTGINKKQSKTKTNQQFHNTNDITNRFPGHRQPTHKLSSWLVNTSAHHPAIELSKLETIKSTNRLRRRENIRLQHR